MNFTIEQAAYHRNGVGGEGFYVGIATCAVDGYDEPKRMLVTFFPVMKQGKPCPAGKNASGKFANGRVAVLEVAQVEDTIAFGHNSWRGDNFYEVADAIVKEASAR